MIAALPVPCAIIACNCSIETSSIVGNASFETWAVAGAVIAINPDALAQARASDARRKAGKVLGPLDGVPVLIKDNIETKDPIATTAGSLALKDNVGLRDAPLVAGLRRQGAVILGKTNLSEWANIRSSNSISGWSAVGGLVRNPYALDRTACGSSSGSGDRASRDGAPPPARPSATRAPGRPHNCARSHRRY